MLSKTETQFLFVIYYYFYYCYNLTETPMPPFDLYLLLTPLFAIILFLGLLAFKLSLADEPSITPNTVQKIKMKQIRENNHLLVKEQSIWTFSYLMRNHSFLEMCITRRAKNKLPIILSITTIGVLSYFIPNSYYFSIVGVLFVFVFVLAQSFFQKETADIMDAQVQELQSKVKDDKNIEKSKKYIYLAYCLLFCGTTLFLCSLVYQNFINSFLQSFAMTFAINSVADIFLVRPLGFLVISFPLIFNLRIQHHIQNQNTRQILYMMPLDQFQLQDLAISLSPKKKQSNSPTKVPKATLSKKNSENEGFLNAMESLRKIKKQKNNQINLMTPVGKKNSVCDENSQALQQYSLNQLFNDNDRSFTSNNHLQQTPIANFNLEQQSCNQSRVKGKRRDSELIIVEFKNRDENDEMENHGKNGRSSESCWNEDIPQIDQKCDQFDGSSSNSKLMRIKQKKLNNELSDDDQPSHNDKHDNFLTIQHQNAGLKSINEQGDQQPEIDQIDLNSPTKRRSRLNSILEDSKLPPKKKKVKHSNSNAKRRVIKFTSGEPYLEYLPNMLSKEANKHTKRSQPINFKSQFEICEDQQKPRKSLKKIKQESKITVHQNNENECPQAMFIEDL